jgi:hypothetical protein
VTMTAAPHTVRKKTLATGAYDRVFYSGLAITLALIVFVGFAPTYYLRPLATTPPVTVTGATTLSPLAHVHGALFTGWVLLFIIQTALIANHRVSVHRRFGMAGAVLALAMVLVAVPTAIAAAARGSTPPGGDPLSFLAIPLFDMVVFPIFVGAALWNRRNKEAHKRLMLLAYVSIITAAIARWPGVVALGPPVFFGLTLAIVLIAAIYDVISRRRVHPVYIWGGGLLVVSVPVRLMVAGTDTWRSIAQFLTR